MQRRTAAKEVCLRTGWWSEQDHPKVSVVSGTQAGIVKGTPQTANLSNIASYVAIYNLLNDFLPISSFEPHKRPFVYVRYKNTPIL